MGFGLGWSGCNSAASCLSNSGLLLVPCNSVHTCFVRFPVDVVFLDDRGCVLAVRHNLRPWRLAFGPRKSHAVLEMPAGTTELQPGEALRLEPADGKPVHAPHVGGISATIDELGKVCGRYNRYNPQSRWRH